jgi:hypothetical protein
MFLFLILSPHLSLKYIIAIESEVLSPIIKINHICLQIIKHGCGNKMKRIEIVSGILNYFSDISSARSNSGRWIHFSDLTNINTHSYNLNAGSDTFASYIITYCVFTTIHTYSVCRKYMQGLLQV